MGIDKTDFLARPLHYLYGDEPTDEAIPHEWFGAAWRASAAFRDEAVWALARSLYKVGSFALAEDWLTMLTGNLSCADLLQLHARLRDAAGRHESVWRAEFEQAFPECVSRLPACAPPDPLLGAAKDLFRAMASGDPARVAAALEGPRALGIAVEALRLPAIEVAGCGWFANAVLGDGVEDSTLLSPLDVAEAEGMESVSRLLRQADLVS